MTNHQKALSDLIALLDVRRLEDCLFEGTSPRSPWQRLYGGQVIAQAMMAACKCVDPTRAPHALHLLFLRPGDPNHPITYRVEVLREGRAFTACQVHAVQKDTQIATAMLSFHGQEAGIVTHDSLGPDPMPALPGEDAPDFLDFAPTAIRTYWKKASPFAMHPVDCARYTQGTPQAANQAFWLRLAGAKDELETHSALPHLAACLLAYASDMTLLDTAVAPEGTTIFSSDYAAASLDHSLWFHRPVCLNDWLLYRQESPIGAHGRAFAHGSFRDAAGNLIASTAQEGLIRPAAPKN